MSEQVRIDRAREDLERMLRFQEVSMAHFAGHSEYVAEDNYKIPVGFRGISVMVNHTEEVELEVIMEMMEELLEPRFEQVMIQCLAFELFCCFRIMVKVR